MDKMKKIIHFTFLIFFICLYHLPVCHGAGSIVASGGSGVRGAGGKLFEETEEQQNARREMKTEYIIIWISAGVLAIALLLGSVFFAVKHAIPYYKGGNMEDEKTFHATSYSSAPKCA